MKKWVDVDQKDKCFSLHTRDVEGLKDENFFYMNEYATKAYREEFLEYINRQFPEFFDENDEQEVLQKAINKRGADDQAEFIKQNCGEYEMPCLVFERNANE